LSVYFNPTAVPFYTDGNDFHKNEPDQKKEIRKQIGMLFQGSALFSSMTVEENIIFPLDMFTRDTRKKKLDRVNEVLERVNLNGANKKFPAELSGGMMKRVGIARAIVLTQNIFLLMNPTRASIRKLPDSLIN
jgi:phospholipid/cholesterol/gamma-HCH transport system ATP-binding protein